MTIYGLPFWPVQVVGGLITIFLIWRWIQLVREPKRKLYKKPIHPAAMNMCPVCMTWKEPNSKYCPRCGRHLLLTFPKVSTELKGDVDPYKIQREQFDEMMSKKGIQ